MPNDRPDADPEAPVPSMPTLTLGGAASSDTFDVDSTTTGGRTAPSPAPRAAPHGRYEVVEELARGGLGRVLIAQDRVLERPVAIKELLRPTPGARARFAREALVTARLEHPSIVPVHDAGAWPTGEPFYTMKLVSGRTLEDVVAERRTLVERLGLLGTVIDVCDAMAYAHSQRVVHRDLKPQNVLVGAFGETVVVDWGLAKPLGEADEADDEPQRPSSIDSGLTRAGAVVGTPAYMPPEQAAGLAVDERADVYALGAILYQVLAGVRPYHERSDVLALLAAGPPRPLAELAPAAPRDLLAIVDKAMARSPGDRYPSAKELAADLERFRTGQIVGAYRYGPGELIARWVRRHRAAAALLLTLVVTIATSFAVVLRSLERERVRADALAVEQARLAVEREPREALALLDGLSPGYAALGPVRTLAADAALRGLADRLPPHRAAVPSLAASPDGARVATASHDRTVIVRDASTGDVLRVLDHPAAVGIVTWLGPDRLATAADRTVRVWDVGTGEVLTTLPHPDFVQSLEVSGDGQRLVTACLDAAVRVWDASGAPVVTIEKAHTRTLMHAALSPDGTRVASSGSDRRVVIWDVATGAQVFAWDSAQPVYRAIWSPDGRQVAVAGLMWSVLLGDAVEGTSRDLVGHTSWVSAMTWLPDGTLATASADRSVRVWPAKGRSRALLGHSDVINMLAATSDGRIASASGDGTVRLWDPAGGGSVALVGHGAPALSVAVTPDGHRLVSGGASGEVLGWDLRRVGSRRLQAGDKIARAAVIAPDGAHVLVAGDGGAWWVDAASGEGRRLGDPAYFRAAASADGRWLAALTYEGVLDVWDGASGALVRSTPAHEGGGALIFAPDGRIATTGEDGVVKLWEPGAASGRALLDLDTVARNASWSADGRWLAVGADDHGVRLLDTRGDTPPRLLEGHPSFVSAVAFAGERLVSTSASGEALLWEGLPDAPVSRALPGFRLEAPVLGVSKDGRWAAVGDGIGLVTLFDLENPDRWRVLVGHTQYIDDLAFSPDGARLASTSWDGTARLWDLTDPFGEAPPASRALIGHGQPVTNAAFAPDGTWLVTTGGDATVRRWEDDLPRDPAALRAMIAALAR